MTLYMYKNGQAKQTIWKPDILTASLDHFIWKKNF
jgi:hypothetical protein